jgi:regulator of sigma E protease
MEFLQLPFNLIVAYIVPFIVALTVIVFVHEFGHYYVARLCGVGVEAFSIGFGKELFGWVDSKGTRWKICALPLGGYVKFEGDANVASMPSGETVRKSPTNFHGKKVWQRAAVVVAGPLANFLLAIAIFAGSYMTLGEQVADPVVGAVVPGSAAEAAGVKKDDVIKAIDGQPISTFNELQMYVFDRAGETLTLSIDRGGTPVTIMAAPRVEIVVDGFGNKNRIGRLGLQVSDKPESIHTITYSLPSALVKGVEQTWFVIRTTMRYLGKIIVGKESADQLRGPPGIAQIAGSAASGGFMPFIGFIGLISVSIGLINLFPVPMLDGGHLVYYGIEALRGKPMGRAAQEWGFRIGLSMVMLLMVVATWNDVARMFGG